MFGLPDYVDLLLPDVDLYRRHAELPDLGQRLDRREVASLGSLDPVPKPSG